MSDVTASLPRLVCFSFSVHVFLNPTKYVYFKSHMCNNVSQCLPSNLSTLFAWIFVLFG